MKNHVHLLLITEEKDGISRVLQRLGGVMSVPTISTTRVLEHCGKGDRVLLVKNVLVK